MQSSDVANHLASLIKHSIRELHVEDSLRISIFSVIEQSVFAVHKSWSVQFVQPSSPEPEIQIKIEPPPTGAIPATASIGAYQGQGLLEYLSPTPSLGSSENDYTYQKGHESFSLPSMHVMCSGLDLQHPTPQPIYSFRQLLPPFSPSLSTGTVADELRPIDHLPGSTCQTDSTESQTPLSNYSNRSSVPLYDPPVTPPLPDEATTPLESITGGHYYPPETPHFSHGTTISPSAINQECCCPPETLSLPNEGTTPLESITEEGHYPPQAPPLPCRSCSTGVSQWKRSLDLWYSDWRKTQNESPNNKQHAGIQKRRRRKSRRKPKKGSKWPESGR